MAIKTYKKGLNSHGFLYEKFNVVLIVLYLNRNLLTSSWLFLMKWRDIGMLFLTIDVMQILDGKHNSMLTDTVNIGLRHSF